MIEGARARLRSRRAASTLLIAGGALVLVGSAASIARAAIARDAARSRWEEMEAGRAVTAARARVDGAGGWSTVPRGVGFGWWAGALISGKSSIGPDQVIAVLSKA